MQSTRSRVVGVVLKLALVAAAGLGLGLSFVGEDGFMTASPLLYFTNQSNLWIGLTALAALVMELAGLARGRSLQPNWFLKLKFVFTVSITLTLLVFAFLLAPMIGGEYLRSPSNLCLHFIVPMLAIADFILCDWRLRGGRWMCLLAAIPPMGYFALTMILSMNGVRYHDGGIVPYYFLDYQKLGWFKISAEGIGVVYWVLVMVVIVASVGLGLLAAKNARAKRLAAK